MTETGRLGVRLGVRLGELLGVLLGASTLGACLWVGAKGVGAVPPVGAAPRSGERDLPCRRECGTAAERHAPRCRGSRRPVRVLYDDRGVPHVFAATEARRPARPRLRRRARPALPARSAIARRRRHPHRTRRRRGAEGGPAHPRPRPRRRRRVEVRRAAAHGPPQALAPLTAFAAGVNAYIASLAPARLPARIQAPRRRAPPLGTDPRRASLRPDGAHALVQRGRAAPRRRRRALRPRGRGRALPGRTARSRTRSNPRARQEPRANFQPDPASRQAVAVAVRRALAERSPSAERRAGIASPDVTERHRRLQQLGRLRLPHARRPPAPRRRSASRAHPPVASGTRRTSSSPARSMRTASRSPARRRSSSASIATSRGASRTPKATSSTATSRRWTTSRTPRATRWTARGARSRCAPSSYRDRAGKVIATDTVRWTPPRPDAPHPAAGWISMRWTALDSSLSAPLFERAQHAQLGGRVDARAMDDYASPPQNMLAADREGIAIRATGHYPVRPGRRARRRRCATGARARATGRATSRSRSIRSRPIPARGYPLVQQPAAGGPRRRRDLLRQRLARPLARDPHQRAAAHRRRRHAGRHAPLPDRSAQRARRVLPAVPARRRERAHRGQHARAPPRGCSASGTAPTRSTTSAPCSSSS